MSLRAILFDFDGVLADSEPIHLSQFQRVLEEEGILLTKAEYYEKYLGLDDRSFFRAIFKNCGLTITAKKEKDLIHKKNRAILNYISTHQILLPGVRDFLKESSSYFRTIVSGALRNEITTILEASGLLKEFHVIVAADDVSQGKPDPEGFLKAVRLLNRDFVLPSEILLSEECLAIEDSPWGIEAAKKSGAKCLAVMTSYPRERVLDADLVVPDLSSVSWKAINNLFV